MKPGQSKNKKINEVNKIKVGKKESNRQNRNKGDSADSVIAGGKTEIAVGNEMSEINIINIKNKNTLNMTNKNIPDPISGKNNSGGGVHFPGILR